MLQQNLQADTFEKRVQDLKDKRKKDLAYERSHRLIAVLTEDDFKEIIGANWMEIAITKFDVSSEKYQLEVLEGMSGGLRHPELKRYALSFVDVSFNRLRDINIFQDSRGFTALTVLLARRNVISNEPKLCLPTLLELNLSHNQLKALPSFTFLPNLQILIISHNKLTGTFEKLKDCPRIKRVDLAYNQYELTPSQLNMCLDALAPLRSLVNLRLFENPFVAYIKQYQVFVLKKLPGLTKLDNVDITYAIRQELLAREQVQDFHGLEDYQDLLDHRREEYHKLMSEKQNKKVVTQRIESLPQLNKWIVWLEDILEDTSCLLENVQKIMSFAEAISARMQLSENEVNSVLSNFWTDLMDYEAAIDQFLELVIGTMERHDTVRRDLTDILGHLAGVASHNLGKKCMELLARLMTSSEDSRAEARSTLDRVVIKSLLRFSSEIMNTSFCEEIIHGLVHMFRIEQIVVDVGEVVEDLLPSFVEIFLTQPGGEKMRSVKACAKLLAYATDHAKSVKKIATEDLVKQCVVSLDNRSLQEDDNMQEYWLDVLRLAGNLVTYGSEDIIKSFLSAAIHTRIITRLKHIRGEGRYLEELSKSEGVSESHGDAAVLSKSIDFVHAMSTKRTEVLHESCKSYRIVKELTELVKMHKQELEILAASIRMLILILEDKAMYREYAGFIISECSKFKPMLQYLGGKKYGELFFTEGSRVPLSGIPTDSAINDVFVAIVKLITFFFKREAEETEDDDDGGEAEQVNSYLDGEERERVLLSMLVVPADRVKFAVMECIDNAPPGQLSLEETSLMIKYIADCQNIGAGQTEKILALTVGILQKLVQSRDRNGDVFREFKAQEALGKCFKVLIENANRATFNEEEMNQKLTLQVALVKYFRSCSHYKDLQDFMRGGHIEEKLCRILQLEQKLVYPLARDVAVERTWMGRSIEFLMRCFRADMGFTRWHKVTFRVLSRIADVLEGKTDGFKNDFGQTAFSHIAACECREWSTGTVERNVRYMDDEEFRDRKEQAQRFVDMDGVRKIIDFLMDDRAHSLVRGYQDRMKEAAANMTDLKKKAEDKKEEIDLEAQKQRASDEIPPVEGIENENEEEFYVSGRALLMESMQSLDEVVDEDFDSMFISQPGAFEVNERIDNMEDYVKNIPAYVVAALLRIIWALLNFPPVESCRVETIRVMRQPKMIMYIMAMMQNKPMLCCNLAAKFLHVMTSVLDVGVFGSTKAEQRLDLCKLLMEYVHEISGMSDGLLKLLRISKDKPLKSREQHLCSEIARMMGMITRVVPYFKKNLFTDNVEAQNEGVAAAIDWIVPPEMIRLCIAMILYELQVDAGAGSGRISQEFVKLAYQKQGVLERATRFIAQLILRCPDRKYDILEAFNSAAVFENQEVRPSYILSLLGEVNLGLYTLHVETFFPEWSGDPHDRVVQLALVEVPADNKKGCFTGLLCASTAAVYLMKPSEQKPAYQNDNDGTRWDPSWDVTYPRDPVRVWTRQYSHIKRIYRCYGSQLMAIEWFTPEEILRMETLEKGAVNPAMKSYSANASLNSDVFVFHREQDRQRFITCLKRNQTKDKEKVARSIPVLNDSVIRGEVLQCVEKAPVLAASCAMPLQDSILGGESCNEFPHLFVLTTKSIISLRLHLTAYTPPGDEHMKFFDEDTFRPPRLDLSDEGSASKEADSNSAYQGKSEEELLRLHLERDGGIETSKSNAPKRSNWPVLAKVEEWSLPPTDVVFNNAADQPDLKINTDKGPVSIRFYDDAGRESWRRALAYYLTYEKKPGKSWSRSR